MKNIDRLAEHVAQHGTGGIIVHSIPGTPTWLIAQKISSNSWLITINNPLGDVSHELGVINDAQHMALWAELVRHRLEKKTLAGIRKEYKEVIKNFIKRSEQRTYLKFTKRK